jgi:hypothetical protein
LTDTSATLRHDDGRDAITHRDDRPGSGTPGTKDSKSWQHGRFSIAAAAVERSSPARLRILLALPAAAVAVAAAGTAQGGATESSLVHRLETCLPAGQAKPTVVLVHGAWADASGWSGEVSRLQAAGYDVRAIAQAGFTLRSGS